ncbi:SRPBCC family protein [Phyllobacterium sp. SB3]|uniref:SRPBCC family protein n=1 Tax=Phyllobacterium sp. SB3 TaxID=3156073 RepID=UPI0032AE94F3
MNEYAGNNSLGVVTAPLTVRIERLLPGPVERIWAYLTESEKRRKWLAKGPIASFVGGDVELTFHHSELSEDPTPAEYRKYEGHINKGKVTRYEPPHILSYTWPDGENEPSEVMFELTAVGADTQLVITHTRLASTNSMVSVATGWHTHLAALIAHLEGRQVKDFWADHKRLEPEYRQIMGN